VPFHAPGQLPPYSCQEFLSQAAGFRSVRAVARGRSVAGGLLGGAAADETGSPGARFRLTEHVIRSGRYGPRAICRATPARRFSASWQYFCSTSILI